MAPVLSNPRPQWRRSQGQGEEHDDLLALVVPRDEACMQPRSKYVHVRIHEILQDRAHAKTHRLNECPAKWSREEQLVSLGVKHEGVGDIKLELETALATRIRVERTIERKRPGIRNGFLVVSTVNTPFYPSIMPPVPRRSGLLRRRTLLHRNLAHTELARGGRNVGMKST
ncbi:hypothetical protein B0H13DRAFT_1922643 [Mycena leptocephala]|nr:hypothetical protein B0H13DRAFT_1922643 [Mycena leptocephala]